MDNKINASLGSLVELLLDAVCVVDADGQFVYVSAAFERIFGYHPDEVIGTQMIELVAPDDRERTLKAASEIMAGNPKFVFENRYIHKDGSVIHIMWSARWIEGDRLRIAVARDITGRKQAEALQAAVYAISEAAHAAEDLDALFCRIHTIIADLIPAANFCVALRNEKDGNLTFPYHADEHEDVSGEQIPAMRALSAEVISTGEAMLLRPNSQNPHLLELRAIVGNDPVCWLGVPLTSPRGTIGALTLKTYSCDSGYTEKDQELLQFVSTQIGTAIERKQLQQRLQQMAHYDELTGLPNRGLLYDRLRLALARARRHNEQMAVLYLDLDDFKHVNDTMGHGAGDLLLQEVGRRMKGCLRETDTVGRMGGDEFVVIVEHVQDTTALAGVVDKIRKAITEPVVLDDHRLSIGVSIGVAVYPKDGVRVQDLLKCADKAMYADKG